VGKIADREYYRSLYVPLWSPGHNAPEAVVELYRLWAPYEAVLHAGVIRRAHRQQVESTGVRATLSCLIPPPSEASPPRFSR